MRRSRQSTWKHLLSQHGAAFIDWLEYTNVRYEAFQAISDILEWIVLEELRDYRTCHSFASHLSDVLSKCDDLKYQSSAEVLAYSHLHFLERYHRFWDVFIQLVRARVLPMSDKGIDVLDVGTGPATALYAVDDFYKALFRFAVEHQIAEFQTPLPRLYSVETSPAMIQFFHGLSEYCERSGPFSATFNAFDNLNFDKMRASRKYYTWWEEDWDGSGGGEWYSEYNPNWQGSFRYNLCIFSYFLTQPKQVRQWNEELTSVFQALKPGGIVCVVGGVGHQYPAIYENVEKLARLARVDYLKHASRVFEYDYDDWRSVRIKRMFDNVWERLRKHVNVSGYKRELPTTIWSSGTEYKNTKHYTLKVFRNSKLPRWYLRKKRR